MDRYVLLILFALNAKAGQLIFANYICVINILCLPSVFLRKTERRVSQRVNPPVLTPPPSDDDASTASQESHVTSPVIYMPLNQDLINANLTVEQLQEFQHVDNVVEVQLQPSPTPPHPTTMFDTAFFNRATNMMNAFDSLMPFLTKIASDRRSPTAGASENVSLNPVASHSDSAPQVPVVAPQDPGLAPGPSSASSESIASTSGLQQRHHDAFASPRGRSGERDNAERSRHASPSLQDRLRRQMDDVRRQLVNAKEIVDVYSSQGRLPPDQARYDLEFFSRSLLPAPRRL